MQAPDLNPPPYIHYPGDGRGGRVVLLNGRELSHVIYADELNGRVHVLDERPKLHKYGKRLIHRTYKGAVTVYKK